MNYRQAYWKDFQPCSEDVKQKAFAKHRRKVIGRCSYTNAESYEDTVNEMISLSNNFTGGPIELRLMFKGDRDNDNENVVDDWLENEKAISVTKNMWRYIYDHKDKVVSLNLTNIIPHLGQMMMNDDYRKYLKGVKYLAAPTPQTTKDLESYKFNLLLPVYNSNPDNSIAFTGGFKFHDQKLKFVFRKERIPREFSTMLADYDFFEMSIEDRFKRLNQLLEKDTRGNISSESKSWLKGSSIIVPKNNNNYEFDLYKWTDVIESLLTHCKSVSLPKGYYDLSLGSELTQITHEHKFESQSYDAEVLDVSHTSIPVFASMFLSKPIDFKRDFNYVSKHIEEYLRNHSHDFRMVNCFQYENNDHHPNLQGLWYNTAYSSKNRYISNIHPLTWGRDFLFRRWISPKLECLIINPHSLTKIVKVRKYEVPTTTIGNGSALNEEVWSVRGHPLEGSSIYQTKMENLKTLILKDIHAMTPHSLKIPTRELEIERGVVYAMDGFPIYDDNGEKELQKSIREREAYMRETFGLPIESNKDNNNNNKYPLCRSYLPKLETLILPDLWLTDNYFNSNELLVTPMESILKDTNLKFLKARFFYDGAITHSDAKSHKNSNGTPIGPFNTILETVIKHAVKFIPINPKDQNTNYPKHHNLLGWDLEYVIVFDKSWLKTDPEFYEYRFHKQENGLHTLQSRLAKKMKILYEKEIERKFKSGLNGYEQVIRALGYNQNTGIRFVYHSGAQSESVKQHLRYLMGDVSITTPNFEWTEFSLTLPKRHIHELKDDMYGIADLNDIVIDVPKKFQGTDAAQEHFWPRKTREWTWWHEKKPFDLV